MGIKQKRAERILRSSLQEAQKEAEMEADRRRRYTLASQASLGRISDMGGAFTWKEMEEQDEMRRRERVELRKMELARQGAYPSHEIEQSVHHWKMKKYESGKAAEQYISAITNKAKPDINPEDVNTCLLSRSPDYIVLPFLSPGCGKIRPAA